MTLRRLISALSLALACVACAPTGSTSASTSEPPAALELEPGWRWLIPPARVPDEWPSGGASAGGPARSAWSVRARGRRLEVEVSYSQPELARTVDGPAPDVVHRPRLSLVFDNIEAFEFVRKTRGRKRQDGFVTTGYVLRGPTETITTVGLAVLDAEGRKIESRSVAARAEEAEVATISLPVLGEALEFPEFETLDGGRIGPDELRGKIVVLDFWATWCSACIDAFPHLRALHDELGAALGPDEVVFVGFNLDESARTAERVARRHELPWAQVHIPADDTTRRMWAQVAGISNLPRVIVLDREGVVRALTLDELEPTLRGLAEVARAPSSRRLRMSLTSLCEMSARG